MREISRVVLAQAAAFAISSPACEEAGERWTRAETAHREAITQREARQAAEPLVAGYCASCPAVAACAAWAAVDKYTGIAAGTAWSNGEARPIHWVSTQSREVRHAS